MCFEVLGQIVPHPANSVGTNPNRASGIKPTASLLFGFAIPAKLASALQIDAVNPPIDDLKKCVMPADLGCVQNHVRPGISADERKWAIELMGDRPTDRPPGIQAFKGQRCTQPASITE